MSEIKKTTTVEKNSNVESAKKAMDSPEAKALMQGSPTPEFHNPEVQKNIQALWEKMKKIGEAFKEVVFKANESFREDAKNPTLFGK